MLLICFRFIEFNQITLINAEKRLQILFLRTIHILTKEFKRLQMTSNDLKPTSDNEPARNKKNKLKGGSIHENIEINEHYLDENLHNNDF